MKKDGRYRFNLSFPAKTEEQIQAGELLERLGNRKSVVVVEALKDYLEAHPALLDKERKVEIKAIQSLSPQVLEELVRKILGESQPIDKQDSKTTEDSKNVGTDISEMLDNMSLF